MRNVVLSAAGVSLAVGLLVCGSAAQAAVTVFGGGLAQECSKAARAAAKGLMLGSEAIQDCTLAIESEPLSTHDLAGTYVNRGILYLARGGYADSKRDFDFSITLAPQLGEAYVNRGAALIAMRRWAEGIVEIDRGLMFNPEEPEKAYFNRGLADEGLNDEKGAYIDYMKALELKPDWDQPKTELTRFTVAPKPKS